MYKLTENKPYKTFFFTLKRFPRIMNFNKDKRLSVDQKIKDFLKLTPQTTQALEPVMSTYYFRQLTVPA